MGRVEQLLEFIRQNPNDPFPRYALALEHKNAERLDDAAQIFAELIAAFPDYTASYLHAGQTLAKAGRSDEARAVFEAGLSACDRKRDFHAKGEIEGALADL
jgi:predicted Zn-dependent protease